MIFKSLKNSLLFLVGVGAALAMCLNPVAQAQTQPAQDFITISGNASYLQRIAMPPEAVLTVQVQDISRAGAHGAVLSESREVFGRRQVPLAYSVMVARSAINPRMRYAVRATISVAGETQFATTRQYPVLTHGAPSQVNLLLAAVPEVGQPASPSASVSPSLSASASASAPSVRFALPATFAGVLPCADCMGIAHMLTLEPDGSYRLHRTYLGKPVEPMVEAGRWTADQNGRRIALHSSAGNPLFFSVRAHSVLRQLNGKGQAIKSATHRDLHRMATFDPMNETAAAQPGSGASTDSGPFTAALQDTYWKLVELSGQPVAMLPGQEREVRITLASQDRRLIGFSGCNALGGSYAQNGASLKFDQLASSMRLCEPALNALERQVLDVLIATTGQRINGQWLSLLAGERVLARFEAVYLK
ncbi:MAG: YbaY family lipoprotein [Polaromonas sp.]